MNPKPPNQEPKEKKCLIYRDNKTPYCDKCFNCAQEPSSDWLKNEIARLEADLNKVEEK